MVYGGLLVTLLGTVSAVWPLRLLAIRSRVTGAIVLFCGVLIFVIGAILPAGETRIPSAQTKLDEFAPVYQFSESHSIQIHSSRERVYEAMRQVSAGEIKLLRTLTWIRRLGRETPPGVLNAPQNEPVRRFAVGLSFAC